MNIILVNLPHDFSCASIALNKRKSLFQRTILLCLTILNVVSENLLLGVRESGSHADADGGSKSNNSSDGKNLDTQGKIQKHRDHSQRNGNFEVLQFLLIACESQILKCLLIA